MNLLIQFLFRLCGGLAVGMAITSSRHVTSGYYRNHLYVTLGLATLAAMVSFAIQPVVFWCAAGSALVSYIGSVCWLYERSRPGKLSLWLIALLCLVGGSWGLRSSNTVIEPDHQGTPAVAQDFSAQPLQLLSVASSGLVLGITMAAMLLGHWYLNTPTMELVPLRRLILAMGGAVGLQMLVAGWGLWQELGLAGEFSQQWIWFLVLRWSFGLVGVAALAWMAWETLKVPNTQSATGILYVAVIGTFVGETMALLLSAESLYPL